MIYPVTINWNLKSSNARNWPGLVVLNKGLTQRAAVWAQEAWESRHKTNPLNLIRKIFSKDHRRRMEYMGHEVECVVSQRVYGQPINDARTREALSLRRGYGGLFAEIPIEVLVQAMKSNNAEAVSWVGKHEKFIRKYT